MTNFEKIKQVPVEKLGEYFNDMCLNRCPIRDSNCGNTAYCGIYKLVKWLAKDSEG